MADEKNELIESCPICGGSIVACCDVPVEYAVTNDDEGGQDWTRLTVDDDNSSPNFFTCGECNTVFTEFELNDEGYLVGLTVPATIVRDK